MTGMYTGLLVVHSLLRWVVLGAALFALMRAVTGASSRRIWTSTDENAGKYFLLFLDLQLLIGLVLYVGLSPITQAAFADFGAAMGNSVMRFWAVEHIFGMLVAVALAHVGRVRARKVLLPGPRHRTLVTFYGLSLLVMLLSIPWPFMSAARPLFRSF